MPKINNPFVASVVTLLLIYGMLPVNQAALAQSTPRDLVVLFGEASAAMSADDVASLDSDTVVSIPLKGDMRVMNGNAQLRAELAELYTGLKEQGVTSVQLADYTITEVSNDFAFARLRWELINADGHVENAVISAYVLRLEQPGWRIVSILEMGAPKAP